MRHEGALCRPDDAVIAAAIALHEAPFTLSDCNVESVREALLDRMWDDVGILRTAELLQRSLRRLAELDELLLRTGVADGDDRVLHMAWHDWINLKNPIGVSRVIALSALMREDSRGAHYRKDLPDTGDLPGSRYIVVQQGDTLDLRREAVRITRVAAGHTVLDEAAKTDLPPSAVPIIRKESRLKDTAIGLFH